MSLITQGYGPAAGPLLLQGYGQAGIADDAVGCATIAERITWSAAVTERGCYSRDLIMGYNIHQLGAAPLLVATFTLAGTTSPLEPDIVKLEVRAPDGTLTTYTLGEADAIVEDADGNQSTITPDDTLEEESPGVYTLRLRLTLPGLWKYRAYSEGVGAAAASSRLLVASGV